ncbi:hypothetical protein [Chishuiella changwenlii]|uniref:hypothetical protein n=1 Tax=Chishuiella changwenlii TaxID=1434701 RepID=UPI002FDAAD83
MRSKFLLFLFLSFSYLNAQSLLDNAIKNLENSYTQEKVYLLLDKNEFIAGENNWFKAFVFKNYQLTDISTTLFVELYDDKKNLIDKKRVLLINGQGDSSFQLKEDLQENIYYIRAYTTYMTNFSEDYQYIKPIPVYNKNSTRKFVLNDKVKWNAELFPEANTFIENQTTKFAVRLFSNGLKPSKWSGYVIDKNKPTTKLVEFENYDENVADFYFKGESNKNYELVVSDESGNKQAIDFPKPQKNGVKLEVILHQNEVKYRLKAFDISNSLKNYKIVATLNNQLVYKAEIKQNTEQLSNGIPLNKKLNGILQISIFNEKDQYVSSRLIFVQPNKFSKKPQLSFDVNQNKRTNNSIQIINPTSSNYAVLINQLPTNENLLSALWLTEDLKTSIQNPNQYFSEETNLKALDALLISEKWKKFNWSSLSSGQHPLIKNKPEPYLSYKGRAIKNGQPITNSTLNFFINYPDSNKELEMVETDEQGNFYLKNIISQDNFSINYFENSAQKKSKEETFLNISLVPLNNFVPLKKELPQSNYILSEKVVDENIASTYREQLENNKKIESNKIKLKEVIIRAEKENKTKKLNDELASSLFKGMFDTTFDFVNNDYNVQSYRDMADWLNGRAAGVTVDQNGVYIRMSRAKLYINEMEADFETFKAINPNDVAMLKVYKNAGLISNAVAIYTRRGNHVSPDSSDSKNLFIVNGYNKSADFLSIDDYDKIYKKVPSDMREVLYWNPNFSTTKENEEIIEYYNNDNPKNYNLTIIGFDKDGFPVFYEGKIN